MCLPHAHGRIPQALFRPLRIPVIRTGESCPASRGKLAKMPRFPRVALGRGPVRPMFLDGGDLSIGIVDARTSTNAPGWLAIKTNWFSMPSYQGPIVIRAARLGANGTIAFNVDPTDYVLVVPPGKTLNSTGLWRNMPGGTYVKTPGCYGWQVDGLTFSDVIVANIVRV